MVDRGLSPPLSGTTFSELHRQTAGAAQINGQQLFQVHYEIGGALAALRVLHVIIASPLFALLMRYCSGAPRERLHNITIDD